MPQPALRLPTPSLNLSIITLPISQTKPQREAGCAEGYVAQCGAGLPQRLKMSLLRWQKEGRVKYSRYSCGYSAPLGLGGQGVLGAALRMGGLGPFVPCPGPRLLTCEMGSPEQVGSPALHPTPTCNAA